MSTSTGTIQPNPSHGLPHDELGRNTDTHTKAFRPAGTTQERLLGWRPF